MEASGDPRTRPPDRLCDRVRIDEDLFILPSIAMGMTRSLPGTVLFILLWIFIRTRFGCGEFVRIGGLPLAA